MSQMENEPAGRWHEWTRGDRLRIAREAVTRSQETFSNLTGISVNTISRYENDAPAKDLYLRTWAMATGYSFRRLKYGEVPTDISTVSETDSQGNVPAYHVNQLVLI